MRTSWIPALLIVLFSASGSGHATVIEPNPDPDDPPIPLPGPALCTAAGGGAFWVDAPRLRLQIDKGVIVYVKNLLTQEVHTNLPPVQVRIPRGMGHLRSATSGSPTEAEIKTAAFMHGPWSAYDLPVNNEWSPFHHPSDSSGFSLASGPGSCVATWSGLTNGTTTFSDEAFHLEIAVAAGGVLRFSASASSPRLGVLSALVPIVNLHGNHRIYLPSFGGGMFDSSGVDYASNAAKLLTLDKAPFWEAPVVGMEGTSGSLGLWITDPNFNPNMLFLSWTGAASPSFGVGIEQLSRLSGPTNPFPYTSISTQSWYLDAFNGNWVAAMTPYKNWYAQQFATELARRAGPAWADKVRVILDQWTRPCDGPAGADTHCHYQCVTGEPDCDVTVWDYLRNLLGKPTEGGTTFDDRVLLYESDARCYGFDTNLPSYDANCLRYPSRNNTLHQQGFRTMGYVNSFCINFGSDSFTHECVGEAGHGLARKYGYFFDLRDGPYAYDAPGGGALPHTFDDACRPPAGTVAPNTCNNPPDSCFPDFPVSCGVQAQGRSCNCSPGVPCPYGEIMCLDPLSPWWRDFHITQMMDWHHWGFDANYEDTAGLAGDFGNDCIDGACGARGATRQFQELQQRMIEQNKVVPLATEYVSDPIGFASHWALRNGYRWAGCPLNDPYCIPPFRRWLATHTRPVSSFLFGPHHSAFVTSVVAMDNFQRHLVASMGDALGGTAQAPARRFDYRASAGDLGHAMYRAKLFANLGLVPDFSTQLSPSAVSWYRDKDGQLLTYSVTANEQKLTDGSAVAQYARISGVTSRSTADGLSLLGWPGMDVNGQVIGLDPAARYNLQHEGLQGPAQPTQIRVTELTPGVKVAKYYETPKAIVLVLNAIPGLPNPPAATNVRIYRQPGFLILKAMQNDVYVAIPPLTSPGTLYSGVPLPARFVFTKQAGQIYALNAQLSDQGTGRFIEKETGIDRGGEALAWHPLLVSGGLSYFHAAGSENAPQTFDWLISIPAMGGTLEVSTFDCATAGDGSFAVVYVNGKEVARNPERLPGPHATCPDLVDVLSASLAPYAGRMAFISVAFDNGAANDANADLRYIARPKILNME